MAKLLRAPSHKLEIRNDQLCIIAEHGRVVYALEWDTSGEIRYEPDHVRVTLNFFAVEENSQRAAGRLEPSSNVAPGSKPVAY